MFTDQLSVYLDKKNYELKTVIIILMAGFTWWSDCSEAVKGHSEQCGKNTRRLRRPVNSSKRIGIVLVLTLDKTLPPFIISSSNFFVNLQTITVNSGCWENMLKSPCRLKENSAFERISLFYMYMYLENSSHSRCIYTGTNALWKTWGTFRINLISVSIERREWKRKGGGNISHISV